MNKSEMWERLVNDCIATEEELDLVTSLNGYTEEVLLDVLYCRTGYRNFEQMDEEY